jgi:hypothetical protein
MWWRPGITNDALAYTQFTDVQNQKDFTKPIPTSFQLTQREVNLSRTVTLRHSSLQVEKSVDMLVGTVPQIGVLMVTHKRNMRSKFR